MTKFDLAEVRDFAAILTACLNGYDNGEGTECIDLDNTLRHYANLCCEPCFPVGLDGDRGFVRESYLAKPDR